MRVTDLDPATGQPVPYSDSSTFALAALLAGAADGCADVFDPAALFDQHAGRFVLSATCGGQGRVLLAASASPDPRGAWFVFGLPADRAGGPGACMTPAGQPEAALPDYTALTYNADGVFVTFRASCPSNAAAGGWGLLAVPKHALYRGMVNVLLPVYDAAQLMLSGEPVCACASLTPAVPQAPDDVPDDAAYFVCEVRQLHAEVHCTQRSAWLSVIIASAPLCSH